MIVRYRNVPEVLIVRERQLTRSATGERLSLAAVREEETHLPLVLFRLVPVGIGHELLFVERARQADRIAALAGKRQ